MPGLVWKPGKGKRAGVSIHNASFMWPSGFLFLLHQDICVNPRRSFAGEWIRIAVVGRRLERGGFAQWIPTSTIPASQPPQAQVATVTLATAPGAPISRLMPPERGT